MFVCIRVKMSLSSTRIRIAGLDPVEGMVDFGSYDYEKISDDEKEFLSRKTDYDPHEDYQDPYASDYEYNDSEVEYNDSEVPRMDKLFSAQTAHFNRTRQLLRKGDEQDPVAEARKCHSDPSKMAVGIQEVRAARLARFEGVALPTAQFPTNHGYSFRITDVYYSKPYRAGSLLRIRSFYVKDACYKPAHPIAFAVCPENDVVYSYDPTDSVERTSAFHHGRLDTSTENPTWFRRGFEPAPKYDMPPMERDFKLKADFLTARDTWFERKTGRLMTGTAEERYRLFHNACRNYRARDQGRAESGRAQSSNRMSKHDARTRHVALEAGASGMRQAPLRLPISVPHEERELVGFNYTEHGLHVIPCCPYAYIRTLVVSPSVLCPMPLVQCQPHTYMRHISTRIQ